ncbi:hypothetical protein FIBSPDRAFT_848122 [Athelia psychrophila]|uniref:Uncharacterized protein n=1 Tax=Athelia psychrophila TaxID=1759441 RepID=A0A166VKZ9_9AGAM|nr:hypothetical protein FIBSPDRAFT_848122 [Fibularhizoctonia sp. CBS 109695]
MRAGCWVLKSRLVKRDIEGRLRFGFWVSGIWYLLFVVGFDCFFGVVQATIDLLVAPPSLSDLPTYKHLCC